MTTNNANNEVGNMEDEEVTSPLLARTLPLKEYQVLALKTKAKSENTFEDYLHSACGLITEVGELIDAYKRHWFYKKEIDRINLKEELGDVLWYIAVGFFALGEDFPDTVPTFEDITKREITDQFILGKMVAYASNPITYALTIPQGWEEDQSNYFNYDLNKLLAFLNLFAERIGTSLEEAAYLNIVKLSKRYPEGFSEFRALNRDTKNELSHISE